MHYIQVHLLRLVINKNFDLKRLILALLLEVFEMPMEVWLYVKI